MSIGQTISLHLLLTTSHLGQHQQQSPHPQLSAYADQTLHLSMLLLTLRCPVHQLPMHHPQSALAHSRCTQLQTTAPGHLSLASDAHPPSAHALHALTLLCLQQSEHPPLRIVQSFPQDDPLRTSQPQTTASCPASSSHPLEILRYCHPTGLPMRY